MTIEPLRPLPSGKRTTSASANAPCKRRRVSMPVALLNAAIAIAIVCTMANLAAALLVADAVVRLSR